MALVATPGAANANSYLTLQEANDYFASRLHAEAWAAASDPQKEAALIWATRLIDVQVLFNGIATSADQSLAWPRTSMLNQNGYAILSTVVPRQLKDATAELAFLLIQSDRTLSSEVGEAGITSLRAGPVTLNFKDNIETFAIPTNVLALLVYTWRYLKDPVVEII